MLTVSTGLLSLAGELTSSCGQGRCQDAVSCGLFLLPELAPERWCPDTVPWRLCVWQRGFLTAEGGAVLVSSIFVVILVLSKLVVVFLFKNLYF